MAEPRNDGAVLEGSVRSALLRLALPILAEQCLVFLVDFYDTYLSGHVALSTASTSAIGIAGYVGWGASLVFGLVGAGTTALVSRHWGAGEHDDANRVANRSVALAALLGALVAVGVVLVAEPLTRWLMRIEGPAGDLVVRYLWIGSIGYLFTGITLIGGAALRGIGNTRTPMLLLAAVSVLNVIVSRSLVYGLGPIPAFGGDGIVWGTVVARAAGCAMMAVVLLSGIGGLRVVPGQLRVRGRTVRRILRVGGPAAVDGLLMWTGHFLFLLVVANLGSDPEDNTILAAHMVGVRVEAISYLPAVAWGLASATIVGQSLGAGVPERARRVGHEAILQCGLFVTGVAVWFWFGAEGIYTAMHDDPRVAADGVPALRLLAWFQVPLVASIVYVNALRGAGDTRFSMIATFVGVYGVRLPVAYCCGVVLEMGLVGAWIGMCSDVTLRAILMAFRYELGRWDRIEV